MPQPKQPEIEQEDIDADPEYNEGDGDDQQPPAVRVVFVFLALNDQHLEDMQQSVLAGAEQLGFYAEHVFVADLNKDDVPASSPLANELEREERAAARHQQ